MKIGARTRKKLQTFGKKAKIRAHYRCQECGSNEFIQAHSDPPGDYSWQIALCGECHSKKHPNVPRALFFQSGNGNPYWHNRSIASLARDLGVHRRTISRATRRLGILPGDLSPEGEQRIRRMVKLNKAVRGDGPYLTVSKIGRKLGLSPHQLDGRIQRGILPAPTFVHERGVRFFDEAWLTRAQAILDGLRHKVLPSTSTSPIQLRVIAVTEKDGKQALVCELDYDGDKELLPEWLRQKIEVQT